MEFYRSRMSLLSPTALCMFSCFFIPASYNTTHHFRLFFSLLFSPPLPLSLEEQSVFPLTTYTFQCPSSFGLHLKVYVYCFPLLFFTNNLFLTQTNHFILSIFLPTWISKVSILLLSHFPKVLFSRHILHTYHFINIFFVFRFVLLQKSLLY